MNLPQAHVDNYGSTPEQRLAAYYKRKEQGQKARTGNANPDRKTTDWSCKVTRRKFLDIMLDETISTNQAAYAALVEAGLKPGKTEKATLNNVKAQLRKHFCQVDDETGEESSLQFPRRTWTVEADKAKAECVKPEDKRSKCLTNPEFREEFQMVWIRSMVATHDYCEKVEKMKCDAKECIKAVAKHFETTQKEVRAWKKAVESVLGHKLCSAVNAKKAIDMEADYGKNPVSILIEQGELAAKVELPGSAVGSEQYFEVLAGS